MGKPIDTRPVTPDDIPRWVLSFIPRDWRDETDEPYPGTFTDVSERWRDHRALRRWQAARREWRESHPPLSYRDLLAEHQRRVVDPIPHPTKPSDR